MRGKNKEGKKKKKREEIHDKQTRDLIRAGHAIKKKVRRAE
jgi:hypothetical protein